MLLACWHVGKRVERADNENYIGSAPGGNMEVVAGNLPEIMWLAKGYSKDTKTLKHKKGLNQ